jgi:cytoskeletal protein RodZ
VPGPRRGALPLALLVVAVLVTGIVIAVARQPKDEDKAGPTIQPTETISPTEEPTETVSPTEEPTETVSPTEEPTETVSPTVEPTEPNGGQVPTNGEPPLAETGGATAPWLLGGAFLIGLAVALWRLSRKPVV